MKKIKPKLFYLVAILLILTSIFTYIYQSYDKIAINKEMYEIKKEVIEEIGKNEVESEEKIEGERNEGEEPSVENKGKSEGKIIYEDIVGWISIPTLKIEYPVMKGEENREYLRRDIRGNYSVYGSIFVDEGCNRDFSSNNTIIYGHNTYNGLMFGNLKKLKNNRQFYEKPTYIYMTAINKVYKYEVYAVYDGEIKTDYYQRDIEDINEYLVQIKEITNVNYCDVTSNYNRIITLSTCSDSNNSRLIVQARLVEILDKSEN